MRQFLDGTGTDTTATVFAYLQTAREIRIADLVLIGDVEDPLATRLTNWESPLTWSLWGTFLATPITRGRITSKIGLEVDTLDFTWSPQLTAFGTSLATSNPYQKAQAGFYDNKTFRLWRTVMPTPGDANTYGACEWFGGLISESTVQRGAIKFVVTSFLNVINQKVPANVIELTNPLANYSGATPVLADSETKVPRFTVVSPSSSNIILATCNSPTLNKIYSNNKFQYGYMVFLTGNNKGYWAAVAANYTGIIGPSHYNEFFVYQSFPFAPAPGDTFYVSTQFPINQADGSYYGFPYVPNPQEAL